MTRRNKCAPCRKAKIKCDESFPKCLNCVRLGKDCIRQLVKRDFKFVEVRGVGVKACDDPATPEQTITTQRHNTAPRVASSGTRQLVPESSQVEFFWPRSEASKLITRWSALTENYIDQLDVYGGWSTCVTLYIGRSEAVDKAARCFMDGRQAMANPTTTNLKALRLSNADAIATIRKVLETNRSQSCKGDILLAIQLLYAVEALLIHNTEAFVIHADGLLSLLKEHKKHLDHSDDQEELINRIIFQSTWATGFVPAMFSGTNHQLDGPEWLTTPILLRSIPGITDNIVEQALQKLAHSFILIPRLARLLRRLRNSSGDRGVEEEAIDLAQHLFTMSMDDEFFSQAKTTGQLRLEITVLGEIVEAVSMSYFFGSLRLSVFLESYWTCRLLICGLVEALLAAVPVASLIFDANALHDEDRRMAIDALMAVQHTLKESVVDRSQFRGNEMRLLMLMHGAYGSWGRLEKRLKASMEMSENEELSLAIRMKRLCLDLVNRLQLTPQGNVVSEHVLEAVTKLYAGGPLFRNP